MKITIDRKTWRFGGSQFVYICGETHLLNEKGFKCCLGFACLDLGCSEVDIRNHAAPKSVTNEVIKGVLINHTWRDNVLSVEAMKINDRYFENKEDREKELTELFKEHGLELVFTGEYINEV